MHDHHGALRARTTVGFGHAVPMNEHVETLKNTAPQREQNRSVLKLGTRVPKQKVTRSNDPHIRIDETDTDNGPAWCFFWCMSLVL